MGWLFVKRRMAAELKQDLKNFIEFDKEATKAASLAVHKAKIKNDDIVACNPISRHGFRS